MNDLDGNNITDSILNDQNYSFWLVMHELKKTEDDEELMAQVNDFCRLAGDDGYRCLALTASGRSEIDEFRKRSGAPYRFVSADNTVLKTMIRSNPGLMLVRNGTVIANWHHNNFPVYSDVKNRLMTP